MDGMTPRQLGFSSFAALAAPMTVLCAGLPWPAALLGLAVGGVGFQVLCSAAGHGVRMAAPLRGAYLLWCLLLLGRTMNMSSLCYPSHYPSASDYRGARDELVPECFRSNNFRAPYVYRLLSALLK